MSDIVSVVVPVYKVEAYIKNIIESIVNQTYKYIELILVNDGTPDKSIEIAQSYLADKQIDWKIINQPNSGLPTARNNGIKAAKGKWVICPDSDDYLAAQTIEKMIEAAEKNNTRCVFCGFKNVYDENITEKPRYEHGVIRYPIQKLRKLFLSRKLILLVPGMLLEKSVYDTIQFDKDCPYDEDIHFMWRLFYQIEDISYIDADYYNYFIRSTSMVHTLRPEAYLATSERYRVMTDELKRLYPRDKFVMKIYPKYRLGGFHVLAKSNTYEVFRNTVIQDGYRKDMGRLILQKNIKLSLYALLYCCSLKLFYKVSK